MQPVDSGTPTDEDIVVRLRRLGRHYGVLSRLEMGPYFGEAAATCNAGAAEVERLRAQRVDRARPLDEVPAAQEAMTTSHLGQHEGPTGGEELTRIAS